MAQPAGDKNKRRGRDIMEFGYYSNLPWLNFLGADKRVPGVLRIALRDMFGSRCADIELDGVRFRVRPLQNFHDMQIARGTLFEAEKEETAFMKRYLRPGSVLVDIGANIGAVSVPLAVKTGCRTVAIEPHPQNLQRLHYNAKINALTDFEIIACAVGVSGTVTLWPHSGNSGRSSVYRSAKSKEGIGVVSKPLLQILNGTSVSNIDVLKIDIEGAEDIALVPFFMESPRSLWPQAVNIEHVSSKVWRENCIDLMVSKGYNILGVTEKNTLLSVAQH